MRVSFRTPRWARIGDASARPARADGPAVDPDSTAARYAAAESIAGRYPEVAREQEPAWAPLVALASPVFTAEAITLHLRLTWREVAALTADQSLLALTTANKATVYPAFQVVDRHLIPGLGEVLRALATGVDDPWAWLTWLRATPPARNGHPPRPSRLDQLLAGDIEGVTAAAQRTAQAWTS